MTEEEKPVDEPEELVPLETDNKIKRAEDAAARLEKANEKMAAQIDRLEQLRVEKTLSGSASAGHPPVQEESNAEYAKRVMRGEK